MSDWSNTNNSEISNELAVEDVNIFGLSFDYYKKRFDKKIENLRDKYHKLIQSESENNKYKAAKLKKLKEKRIIVNRFFNESDFNNNNTLNEIFESIKYSNIYDFSDIFEKLFEQKYPNYPLFGIDLYIYSKKSDINKIVNKLFEYIFSKIIYKICILIQNDKNIDDMSKILYNLLGNDKGTNNSLIKDILTEFTIIWKNMNTNSKKSQKYPDNFHKYTKKIVKLVAYIFFIKIKQNLFEYLIDNNIEPSFINDQIYEILPNKIFNYIDNNYNENKINFNINLGGKVKKYKKTKNIKKIKNKKTKNIKKIKK